MAEKMVGTVVLVDDAEKPVEIYTESDILKKYLPQNGLQGATP
jgi:predicted transcriptional regulator